MLCRYPDVPDNVVQALIEAYPEALVLRGGLFQSTPLAVACERGVSNSVITLLVQANPDTLTMTDGRGLTPLQIAEQHGHGRIVDILNLQQLSRRR
jgi:ankyrin repeat protein